MEDQSVNQKNKEKSEKQIPNSEIYEHGKKKIPQNGELLELFTFSVQFEGSQPDLGPLQLPVNQCQKLNNFIKNLEEMGASQQKKKQECKLKFFLYEEFLEEVEIREGQKPMIISTDIGGTLVGNLELLRKFQHLYLKHYYFDKKSKLIYNSGRSVQSYSKSEAQNNLIKPDYFISRCGVIIYENKNQGEFEEIKEWTEKIVIDWDYKLIEKKVQQIKWLIQKVNQNDRNLCIKYLCSNEEFEKHADEFYKMERELHESNLNFECIVRTKKDKKSIDFIPISTNKGQALEYLCSQKIHVGLQQVYAFGDTMNDCAMLEMAGKGILVKNSMDDVVQWMDELNQAKEIYSKQLYLSGEKKSSNGEVLGQNNNSNNLKNIININLENSSDSCGNNEENEDFCGDGTNNNKNSKNLENMYKIQIEESLQKQICKCQIERQSLLERFVKNNYKNLKGSKKSYKENINSNNLGCMCPEEEQLLNKQLKKSPEYIINQNNSVKLSEHEYAGALLDVIEQQISSNIQ